MGKKNYFFYLSSSFICFVFLSLAFLAGCDDAGVEAEEHYAYVKIIHSSPDAGPVNIYSDNVLVVNNLGYRGASSFLRVKAGNRAVKVTSATDSASIVTLNIAADTNSYYTVVLPGSFTEFSGNAAGLIVTEDTLTAPSGNNIKLRVLHAFDSDNSIPNNTHVDVHAGTDSAFTPGSSNIIIPGGMAFLASSEYQIFSNPQTVKITPFGSTASILSLTINGSAGKIYTVVISGHTPAGAPGIDWYADN